MSGVAPRLYLFTASRRLAIRPRPAQRHTPTCPLLPAVRYASDRRSTHDLPVTEGEVAVGPNMNQQEHVSEEAAKMAKVTGGEGPDLSQGTPVQEILQEDKEARKDAPQVLKESIKSKQPAPRPQGRLFSTLARRQQEQDMHQQQADMPPPEASMPPPELSSETPPASSLTEPIQEDEFQIEEPVPMPAGVKFGMPAMPIPSRHHKDHRYDPVVEQVTNLMMRHGEKAKAQRLMSEILQILRTSPPPVYNPARPLMPDAPPAAHLPLDPVRYLTLALDSLAPLLRLRSQRGIAGGGAAVQIPIPLTTRQRRRQAFVWVLDAVNKKPYSGAGKFDFAKRVAAELVAVVEGRSSLWDRRTSLHKVATTSRANLLMTRRNR